MSNGTRTSGLLAAGLGWGAAIGVAIGMLLIAPAMNGTLGPANASASSAGTGPESAGGDIGANSTDSAGSGDSGDAFRAEGQADAANALLAAEAETILAEKLVDVPVTIIRTAGAHDEDIAALRGFAETAGATDAGEVVLTDKFFQRDAADELSNIIVNTLPSGAQLSVDNRSPGTHAGESLAAALAVNPDTGEAYATDDDRALVLDALSEAGFIERSDGIVPAGVLLVVTGELAPNESGANFAHQLLNDFADALGSKSRVVLATPGGEQDAKHAHPVGHVDTDAGRIGAVLAAGDLVAGQQ